MTTPFENFVNIALGKSVSSDVTLPTADEIPVFTGIGRQVTGKTATELGLATSSQLTDKADLVDGLVPANQLPGYVDDVLEYADLASFPLLGEASKLYIAIDTNLVYRWSGSTYAVTSSSLALGDTSTTAYRGDRGKTAYDHSQATGNPHNLPAASTGADGYLTSSDWNTFNGKQAALGDVITANTYGSSTQYPIVTVNAKGIVTGITLQTVAAPATFSDSAFRIQDNGDATKQIAFEASGIATGQTKTITMPNADVNLSDIPSISNFNSNTVSNNGTILSRNSSSNAVNGVVLLSGDSLKTGFGYTIAGAVVVQTGKGQQSYFRPAVFDTLLTDLTSSKISSPLTLTSVVGTANKPYAGAPAGAEFWILAGGLDHVAVHTLTFACSVFGGISQGVFSGQRRIMVRRLDATDTYTIDNIQTIGTDAVSAGITGVSVAITLDSDRLNIVISHTTATSDHILTSAELHTLVTSLG